MIQSLVSISRSPYNKKHPVFALYRLLYWKMIRALKLKNVKFSIWKDRKIYLNYDSFQCMWVMYNYIVDWEEFNLIRDYVNTEDHVADVGANIGYYTVWMSKFISGKGIVHSFEPDQLNFEKLQKNISLNNIQKNTKANNIALSSIDGFIQFTVSLDGENHISNVENKNTVKVASSTFDTYCQENSIVNLTYVKVDVEGFEADFLKGSADLLKNKNIDILQLEINATVVNSGKSVEDVLWLLKSNGYQLCKYDILKKELVRINYTKERENYFSTYDMDKMNIRLSTAGKRQA